MYLVEIKRLRINNVPTFKIHVIEYISQTNLFFFFHYLYILLLSTII